MIFLKWVFGCIGKAITLVVMLLLAVILISYVIAPSKSSFVVEPNDKGLISVDKTAPLIISVPIKGIIGARGIDMSYINKIISKLDNEDGVKGRVKAILLEINSPGGEIFTVNNIYKSLLSWKNRSGCKIYAYTNGLCASGGFYLACAADVIYADQVSLIGSIGVVSSPLFNVKEALNKVGIQAQLLSAGKNKTDMSPFIYWKPDEAVNRQRIIDSFYDEFVNVVVKHRTALTKENIIKDVGANILTASSALEVGFIDKIIENRDDLIKDIAEGLGIKERYNVVRLSDDVGLQKLFARVLFMISSGTIKHELQIADLNAVSSCESLSYMCID